MHKLPDGLSLAAGSLSEPLAVAVHAVIEQSPSLAGEVVVVIGPGAIGLLCAQVAHAVGATVVLVGRSRHADRLALARRLGVDHTIDSQTEDVEAVVGSMTDGYGAHSVFECSGADGVLEGVAPLLRKGGRIVLVAFFHEQPSVDVDRLINNELELVGSRGKRASSFRTALRLVESGQIDLEPVIGARLPLDEWEKGIELVARASRWCWRSAPSLTRRGVGPHASRLVAEAVHSHDDHELCEDGPARPGPVRSAGRELVQLLVLPAVRDRLVHAAVDAVRLVVQLLGGLVRLELALDVHHRPDRLVDRRERARAEGARGSRRRTRCTRARG